MSWRDEQRKDRVADAEQRRENAVMVAAQRRADAAAVAEQRRVDAAAALARDEKARAARAARREKARTARSARRGALAGWVRGHTLDLLFVPVILVPAVLAWSAMARFGVGIYGGVGFLLPLFSEAVMWVFSFAVTLAVRAGRPTLWLRVGVVVGALVSGALNYIDGARVAVSVGVLMAVVSVGGVVVHQLITAGPARTRRTRAEREAARLARLARRRVTQVRRAAVRHAVAELDTDGTARLVFRPGLVTITRPGLRAPRLVEAIVSGLPTEADPVGDSLADEIGAYLSGFPAGNGGNTPGTAQTRPDTAVPAAIAKRVPTLLARVRAAIDNGKLPTQPTRGQVQKLLRVRAEVAVAVTNALHHTDGTDDGQEVSA